MADYLRGGEPDSQRAPFTFLRLPFVVLLPAGFLVAVLAAALGPGISVHLILAPILVSTLLSGIWIGLTHKSLSLYRIEFFQQHPADAHFREWLVAWGATLSMFLGSLLLLLAAAGSSEQVLVTATEVGVLSATILFLALFARYTAMSFSLDAHALGQEFRAGTEAVGRDFLAGTETITKAYSESTQKIVTELETQGKKQAHLLEDMARVLNQVSELLAKDVEIGEQTKRMGEEAVRIQQAAEAARAERERQRDAAAQFREEREKARTRPEIGILLLVTGLVGHALTAAVYNRGMLAQNAEVSLIANGFLMAKVPLGTLGPRQSKQVALGSVSPIPNEASLVVSCVVADSIGRKYEFASHFQYRRTPGFFASSGAVTIGPTTMQFPVPSEVG